MRSLLQGVKKAYALIGGVALLVVLVILFSFSERGVLLTEKTFDIVRQTENRQEAVIIGVDDASLQAIGAWPWNREVFARLTDILSASGARVIVYDVLFLEPREGDEALRTSLVGSEVPVVLASKVENKTYLSSYLAEKSSVKISSAIANVNPDADGKVRSYALPYTQEGVCVKPLAQIAFEIITFNTSSLCEDISRAGFRYPDTIPTYSLTDVLEGKVSENTFTNKTVFIGATSLDLLDTFVGMNGEKVPGVYVHTSQFVSYLNDVHDAPLGKAGTMVWFLAVAVLTMLAYFRFRGLKGQVGFLVGGVASILVLSVVLFDRGIILPLPHLLLLILLVAGYSTLIQTIAERKKNAEIEGLFAKYVHKDVLSQLMKNPSSINLKGERKDLTILFSDLRGFTTFSEKMEPEELTALLNDYLSAMMPCILEEKGTVDKFIGDAIMAFWNAPLPVPNHTRHGVKAALRMQETLVQFNKERGTTLAMGIGVHHGEVIVGNVGSTERVNYTILGDPVNLASRLEGITKKYGTNLLVTDVVRDQIDDPSLIFRKLDVMTVKGKSEPTTLYEPGFLSDERVKLFKDYEKAFALYQKGDFNEAETIFKKLIDQGDGPSVTMLERLPILRRAQVWDGIWHFDEK